MKITLIQTHLIWEDAKANRSNFTSLIEKLNQQTDLIVLPEMFTTGFTMNPETVYETMEGESVSWMKETAMRTGCALTGSLVIKENGNYYNRLLFVYPDGSYKTYNKRHLFTLAGEDKHYTAGKEKLIVDYKGWKICLQVCYDLRFPVFARNTEDYDLLLFPANWPKQRTTAWDSLLRARAIENMCYTIGVNRIGTDNNGHEYSGHTQLIGPLGEYLLEPAIKEGVYTIEISKEELLEARDKFGFLKDRDNFTLLPG